MLAASILSKRPEITCGMIAIILWTPRRGRLSGVMDRSPESFNVPVGCEYRDRKVYEYRVVAA